MKHEGQPHQRGLEELLARQKSNLQFRPRVIFVIRWQLWLLSEWLDDLACKDLTGKDTCNREQLFNLFHLGPDFHFLLSRLYQFLLGA